MVLTLVNSKSRLLKSGLENDSTYSSTVSFFQKKERTADDFSREASQSDARDDAFFFLLKERPRALLEGRAASHSLLLLRSTAPLLHCSSTRAAENVLGNALASSCVATCWCCGPNKAPSVLSSTLVPQMLLLPSRFLLRCSVPLISQPRRKESGSIHPPMKLCRCFLLLWSKQGAYCAHRCRAPQMLQTLQLFLLR